MIAVNQFLPHLHRGDAIGDSSRLMAEHLRKWGFQPRIYCYDADPGLFGQSVLRVADYRPTGGPEVQILHYALPSGLSTLYPRLPGRRILLHHNLTPARFFAGLDPEMAELVQRGAEDLRQLARATDLGLGDSEWNRLELEALGYRRTGVLPILMDFARYDAQPRPGLLHALDDGMRNLLFVGRLAPNKQQEQLLKLFKLFHDRVEPRSRLILVGKPDRHHTYAAALMDLLREQRIDNVHFAGEVDHADLCTYYRAAHLFVSASAHEGFCVPLLEAFHFDLPVLALRSSAVPYTLGGAGLSFDRLAYPELCELIARLLEDAPLRRRVVQVQRRRLEDFATERVAQILRSSVEALLG